MGDNVQIGTPTMVLLPAANYQFTVDPQQYTITLTKKGLFKELDAEYYKEEDGAFAIFDDENSVMYLPAITKVLFAEKKYPAMETDQMFAPVALVVNEDTVDVVGHILKVLTKESQGE